MNLDNFIVRSRRRLVEIYAKPELWMELDQPARGQLATEIAGLPFEQDPEAEEAKPFDLLLLNLQLSVLLGTPGFAGMKDRVMEIASALESQSAIPVIRDQMVLIQEVQTDEWWQDVTVPMLETVRKRLRGLVHLIEKTRRTPIYTDFEDQIGDGQEIEFARFTPADAFERFRRKARHFLRDHETHVAIAKLRMNRPLTLTDLQELERMLRESGIGTPEDVVRAKTDSHGLGLFVRSLVGLDRGAAKAAFDGFLEGKVLHANQIEFIGMVIDHLTDGGMMEIGRLYESPFTNISAGGPEAVFGDVATEQLVLILKEIRQRAVA